MDGAWTTGSRNQESQWFAMHLPKWKANAIGTYPSPLRLFVPCYSLTIYDFFVLHLFEDAGFRGPCTFLQHWFRNAGE